MINLKPYGQLLSVEVDNFQKQVGFDLPFDYQFFLLSNNGGRVNNQIFHIDEIETDILMHVFYGLGLENKVLNLDFWYNKYSDEIPEHSLLIGNDQGAGFILYIIDGEDSGVYYYDHTYSFKQSSNEQNVYYLADTFQEFVDSLKDFKS